MGPQDFLDLFMLFELSSYTRYRLFESKRTVYFGFNPIEAVALWGEGGGGGRKSVNLNFVFLTVILVGLK